MRQFRAEGRTSEGQVLFPRDPSPVLTYFSPQPGQVIFIQQPPLCFEALSSTFPISGYLGLPRKARSNQGQATGLSAPQQGTSLESIIPFTK